MYQIMDAHGSNVEVTAVAVDGSGTRMFTGGYDGKISARTALEVVSTHRCCYSIKF